MNAAWNMQQVRLLELLKMAASDLFLQPKLTMIFHLPLALHNLLISLKSMLDWHWCFQFTVLITKLERHHAKPSIYCHDVAHDYHENLKSSIPKVCHQSLLSIDDYAFGALPLQVYSYIVPLWSHIPLWYNFLILQFCFRKWESCPLYHFHLTSAVQTGSHHPLGYLLLQW